MRTLGNIIWLIVGGLLSSLSAFVTGILLCITIIFIPIGLQYFKLAGFLLWPLGKEVKEVSGTTTKRVINIVYAILFGWILFYTTELLVHYYVLQLSEFQLAYSFQSSKIYSNTIRLWFCIKKERNIWKNLWLQVCSS